MGINRPDRLTLEDYVSILVFVGIVGILSWLHPRLGSGAQDIAEGLFGVGLIIFAIKEILSVVRSINGKKRLKAIKNKRTGHNY